MQPRLPNPDFVSLLCSSMAGVTDGAASEGAGSINPFVNLGLFSGKAIATQAHPKNKDAIVSAQQHVKLMCAPSMCRKGTIKWMAALHEDSAIEEQDWEEDEAQNLSFGPTPYIADEFRAAPDMLFDTLSEMQSWFVFCVNPNNLRLLDQLEEWSTKGQIWVLGSTKVLKQNINIFEVGLISEEFCAQYKDLMTKLGIVEGSALQMDP